MKINKLNKGIGYLRETPIMNSYGDKTLDQQRAVIIMWSKRNNVEIVKFYSESDCNGKSPVFNFMLNEIDKNIVTPDVLVVSSLGKLIHCADNIEVIEKKLSGIKVITACDSLQNIQGIDLLLNTFIGLLNEDQITRNSSCIQQSLNANANNGFFTGGTPPFGYYSKVLKNNELHKVLVINPLEAAIVKDIFNSATTNTKGKTPSLGGISRDLNQQNLLRRGKQWNYK